MGNLYENAAASMVNYFLNKFWFLTLVLEQGQNFIREGTNPIRGGGRVEGGSGGKGEGK